MNNMLKTLKNAKFDFSEDKQKQQEETQQNQQTKKEIDFSQAVKQLKKINQK